MSPESMSTQESTERRRHPRRDAEWPVTLSLPDGYFDARLRDVSSSGACFHLDRPLPEMTQLSLQLDLPEGAAADGGEVREAHGPRGQRVRGTGVVVRCQRVSPALDHYEVAVFFHQLEDEDRLALERFVTSSG